MWFMSLNGSWISKTRVSRWVIVSSICSKSGTASAIIKIKLMMSLWKRIRWSEESLSIMKHRTPLMLMESLSSQFMSVRGKLLWKFTTTSLFGLWQQAWEPECTRTHSYWPSRRQCLRKKKPKIYLPYLGSHSNLKYLMRNQRSKKHHYHLILRGKF